MQNAECAAVTGAVLESGEKTMPEDLRRLFGGTKRNFRKIIAKSVEIFPEEEKMPLYRYYRDYPLHYPPVDILEYIESTGPMESNQAILPQNFTELLSAEEYGEREIGYCLLPDGSGYVAAYGIRPACITEEMERWYRRWCRYQSRSAVYGHGNLRYKIGNPADQFDAHYVNHLDERLGTYFRRSMDLGDGGKQYELIRHSFSLKEFGVNAEHIEELKAHGCSFGGKGYYETSDVPGSTLCLSIVRPCPLGGTEIRSRKWVGWRPVKGMLIRDPYTKCTETYLKNMLIHMLAGREHLYSFLYELYEEYHDLPMDAD